LLRKLTQVERQPGERLRGGRTGLLGPAEPLGLHKDPAVTRAGVGDGHAQQFAGARAAGQKQVKQRPVAVAFQPGEQVLQHVIRHGSRLVVWLFLPVGAAAIPLEGLQRVVVGIKPSAPVAGLRWDRRDEQ
jgi:hypothetical protein